MSAGSPSFSEQDLFSTIRPFRRRLVGLDVGQITLLFAGSIVLALVFLMWADTVWALPATVRWVVTRIGLLVAGASLISAVWFRGKRITNDSVADRIDQSIQSGGEVLAGWQLATRPVHPHNDLSKGFAAMAARRAMEKVRTLTPDTVGSWRLLQNAALYLAIVSTITLCLFAIIPGIAWNQVQRFLFPASDIPPYTGTVIELMLEKETVLYGQEAYVSAEVVHGKVDRIALVATTDSGQESVLPMLAQDDSQWQAILTRVTEPLNIYARSGASRSRVYRLEVQLTPQILPPKVTITPPTYTKGSIYRGLVPDQGLIGLSGTTVDWEVSSNRPLSSGRLLISYRGGTTEMIELLPAASEEDSSKVTGQMTLSKAGAFELTVVDVDGIESQDKVTGSISILEDRRPVVRITSPQQMSLATPDVKLPVIVNAEDDYGITSLTLYRSLNGSPATPVSANIDYSAQVQWQWNLELPSYSLEPGDEIKLFARTEDNDPSGAKGAESPVTTIRIISVQEFQQMMVQRKGAESIQAKYQAARRYFDQLASALREVQEAQAALDANPDSAEAAQKLQEKLEAAKAAAQQAAQETEKLSQQSMPIDIDQELAKRLAEMSEQAAEMAEQLDQIQQNSDPAMTPPDQQKIEQMLEQSGDAQKKLTDEAIDPLNKMQKAMPLIVDQQRFTQIAQQQRDLANRLNSLKESNSEDPATQRRISELESEQEQLRENLNSLLDDIQSHAESLPDDPETDQLKQTALEFAKAVRDSQASSEMSSAQEKLLSDEFSSAQQNAEKAAEILESFLENSEGMGNQACENCKAAFKPGAGGPKLGNSIEQMLAMMGMKPGSSGMKPGGSPGMGMGFGAGGGFAQRTPGPQNVGMYGSLPMPQQSQSRGRGDSQSPGFQTSQAIDSTTDGGGDNNDSQGAGTASGQSMNSVPANYRSKVAEYFRNLSEKIGDSESNNGGSE